MREKQTQESDEPSPQPAPLSRLFEPVDIASLVFFRVLFGLLCLYLMTLNFPTDVETPMGVKTQDDIHRYYIERDFNFTYYGFDWVKPWPGNGMYWHFAVLGGLALCVALGLFYRVSAALFCLGYTYVFLLEQARYLNHYYLICLISLLLVFIPAHRAFSLDALLRPSIRSQTAPAWALWLIRFQVGLVYFYAGVAKLNYDWLTGKTVAMLMGKRGVTDQTVVMFMSYSGMLFDLLVVPFLLWRRTRVFAFIAALCFNITNSQVFHIDIFPWFMICATLMFFDPGWPRRVASWFLPIRDELRPPAATATPVLSLTQKVTIALLGAYAAIQILLPLRHHLYAGNTNWTNNAHRFAWRMLLRQKDPAEPIFRVAHVVDGKIQEFPMKPLQPPFLAKNDWQFRKMLINPDMILQFAHHQARSLEQRGYRDVKIYAADLRVALTGRPYQQFIDPTVNLADEPRRLFTPYPWVLPLRAQHGEQLNTVPNPATNIAP